MLINVFRGTKLENMPENLEPHARLDAPMRQIWSAPHVLRCAPEKNAEHPAAACVEMRPWCFFCCWKQFLVNPHIFIDGSRCNIYH